MSNAASNRCRAADPSRTMTGRSGETPGGGSARPASNCNCTLPSAPAVASSVPPVTNSQPSTRSAGRRTSSTWALCTQRLAASIAGPLGCLPKRAGSSPIAGRFVTGRCVRLALLPVPVSADRRSPAVRAATRAGGTSRPSGLSFAAGGPDLSSASSVCASRCLSSALAADCHRASNEPAGITALAGAPLVGLGVEMPDAGDCRAHRREDCPRACRVKPPARGSTRGRRRRA